MVITSYFLSRHLHRPCVTRDLSTIHVPQLWLNMVIVVVNHVLKHVTGRNHIVITTTGTLNKNTPLSTSIINKLLSARSCSPNTGISPLLPSPSSTCNSFNSHLRTIFFWSSWSENYIPLRFKTSLIKPQHLLKKNTLDFARTLRSLSFKLRKHSDNVYTNIIFLPKDNAETGGRHFRKQGLSSERKCRLIGWKWRNFRNS